MTFSSSVPAVIVAVLSVLVSVHAATTNIPRLVGGEDGIVCSVCQDAIVGIEDFIGSNKTVTEIVNILDDICDALPAKAQAKCLAEVQDIAPQLSTADLSITTKYSPFALCAMLGTCQIDCCATPIFPEQVHISITNKLSEMVVMWATLQQTPHPQVQYGSSATNLTMAMNGTIHSYTSGGWQGYIYVATMTGLVPGTKYYYRVGDPTVAAHYWMKPNWSQVPSMSFITRTAPSSDHATRVAVIGDAGATDASMLTLAYITQLTHQGKIDFLFHDGDIGYADGYQTLWDEYVRKIEGIAAFVPYMTVQGNHEGFYDFKPYMARFTMPWKQSGSDSPLFYSFDYGNAHYVAVNSESEFGLEARDIKPTDPMYLWLEKDLAAASQASATPWIIVALHRPLYCFENNNDCEKYASRLQAGIEDLLHKYKVDLVIQAHRHNYQVTYPVYKNQKMGDTYTNPTAPVYIVNGAAGNKEHLNGANPVQPWARFSLEDYGYGIIELTNATSLTWLYYAAADNSLLDTFTITK
eukprot:m.20928 g.20928  ORF g.20928 m.20928 type:complete len:524 (+) comp5301_c0_seq1:70-1641(+)